MTTQTIYRLTAGQYDDLHTLGVFASRELAERFLLRKVLAHESVEYPEIVAEQLVTDDIDDDTPED
jgi:hypothetical protein